jgi:hypothetical protein
VSRPRNDLRDVPTTTGKPIARSRPAGRRSSRLWAPVLPKPMPGSTWMRSGAMPGRDGEGDALLQEGPHVVDHVAVARVVLHGARLAEHVHQAALAARLGDHGRHLRIAAQRGDVVDEARPGGQRRAGHRGLRGVDAQGGGRSAASASTTGRTRRSSSSCGTGVGARPGRLAAHVDELGALGGHLAAVGDRGAGVEPLAAVGERVRRDVEDAHDAERRHAGDRRRAHCLGRRALGHCTHGHVGRRRPADVHGARTPRRAAGRAAGRGRVHRRRPAGRVRQRRGRDGAWRGDRDRPGLGRRAARSPDGGPRGR